MFFKKLVGVGLAGTMQQRRSIITGAIVVDGGTPVQRRDTMRGLIVDILETSYFTGTILRNAEQEAVVLTTDPDDVDDMDMKTACSLAGVSQLGASFRFGMFDEIRRFGRVTLPENSADVGESVQLQPSK